jgi:hypothetical protein
MQVHGRSVQLLARLAASGTPKKLKKLKTNKKRKKRT